MKRTRVCETRDSGSGDQFTHWESTSCKIAPLWAQNLVSTNELGIWEHMGQRSNSLLIYLILLCPNTHDLYLLLFYTTVSLNFVRGPISELTTHSPRMVNNSTIHPHPTRRNVTLHMKCNHTISCYIILHATFINFG